MNHFFKNLFLFSQAKNRQNKCIVIMAKEGYIKIVNFITPGIGFLCLGHISYIVEIHYFFKNLLLYSQAQIRQTEGIVMMSKEGSNKIVNFMTPKAGILVLGWGQISHMVKMHYFCNNLHLFPQTLIRQTDRIVMMTKEGSTKIVNNMTPGAGVLVHGRGHIVNMQYFFSSSCLH